MSSLSNLHLWWLAIWHHFVHGTLPQAPIVGGDAVTIGPVAPKQTPPAPELPHIAPQHVNAANANAVFASLDYVHSAPPSVTTDPPVEPLAETATSDSAPAA